MQKKKKERKERNTKKGRGAGEKETNMTLVTVFSLNSFTKKYKT